MANVLLTMFRHRRRIMVRTHLDKWLNTKVLLIAQGVIALGSLAYLLAAPTQSRPMMFIPISASASADVASLATTGDRRLLGSGPVPGSLVVRGTPQNPIRALFKQGVLIIAVSYSSCTSPRQ